MACRRPHSLFASLAAGLVALSGCAREAGPPPSVALVVGGEPVPATRIESSAPKQELGVDLRVVHAPAPVRAPPPESTAKIEERLALARADYASGELARVRSCADRLAEPELVWSALERQARTLAARLLVWRIACTTITRRDAAVETARAFASLGLELPSDVDAIPVEAHKILTAALQTAETTPKREVAIRAADGAHALAARVTLDGRAVCTTDCTVSVMPGDHVIRVEREGWMPATQTVRVTDAPHTQVTLTLAAAGPDLAARQWASSYALEPGRIDSNESVALLSQALRVRRLVYLQADTLGAGVRIRGALAIDGKVAARDEQRGTIEGASSDVLRELLVRGGVVENKSVFQKPLFWIGVAATALASSLLTAYLLYDPGTRTEVRTR